jgi:hypothetical protein
MSKHKYNHEPNKAERQQRHFASFALRAAAEGGEDSGALYIEGVAATFDTPTVLYECGGVEYREIIAAGAFDDTNMTDVIFNYNHGGKVLARTRNGTLEVWTDADGLKMRARLDGTAEGRALYEEISGGYIDRMSFMFTIQESAYDEGTTTATIQRVKRLYDVSAVDIPAYDTTSISARGAYIAEAIAKHRAAEAAKLRRQCLRVQAAALAKRVGHK